MIIIYYYSTAVPGVLLIKISTAVSVTNDRKERELKLYLSVCRTW